MDTLDFRVCGFHIWTYYMGMTKNKDHYRYRVVETPEGSAIIRGDILWKLKISESEAVHLSDLDPSQAKAELTKALKLGCEMVIIRCTDGTVEEIKFWIEIPDQTTILPDDEMTVRVRKTEVVQTSHHDGDIAALTVEKRDQPDDLKFCIKNLGRPSYLRAKDDGEITLQSHPDQSDEKYQFRVTTYVGLYPDISYASTAEVHIIEPVSLQNRAVAVREDDDGVRRMVDLEDSTRVKKDLHDACRRPFLGLKKDHCLFYRNLDFTGIVLESTKKQDHYINADDEHLRLSRCYHPRYHKEYQFQYQPVIADASGCNIQSHL